MSKSNCLQSFCKFLKDIELKDDEVNDFVLCFRGQASKQWKIEPSILRNGNENISRNFSRILEEAKSFYPNEFSDSKFENLAKLQHYGIPTILLDVSFNALVSLYFAVQDSGHNNGCVFACKIPVSNMKIGYENISDNNSEKKMILVKPTESNLNIRIHSQAGAFLYLDNEDWSIPQDWLIGNVEIPFSSKTKIQNELRLLNISSKTIIPEFSEYHKEIERLYK